MSFTSVRKCAGGNYGESAEGSGTGWPFGINITYKVPQEN